MLKIQFYITGIQLHSTTHTQKTVLLNCQNISQYYCNEVTVRVMRIHMQAFIKKRGQKQAWVRQANRYVEDKTKSSPVNRRWSIDGKCNPGGEANG